MDQITPKRQKALTRVWWNVCSLVLMALAVVACRGEATTGPPAEVLDASSPLTESVGRLSADELERVAFEEETLIQERAASCMARLGFDYTPFVTPVLRPSTPRPEDALPIDEFVAKYGYGISTLTSPEQERPNDPNALRLAEMTPTEARAFTLALVGFDPAEGEPFQMQESGRGCDGDARRSVQPPNMPSAEELSAYRALIADVSDRINSDRRVLAAMELWRQCMDDAGFGTFADPGEAVLSIYMEWEAITGPDPAAELAVLDLVAGLDPAVVAAGVGSGVFEGLQQFEVATATADFECARGIEAVIDEVRSEVEREVVERNWPLLVAVAPAVR